jgi:hypothetical protein
MHLLTWIPPVVPACALAVVVAGLFLVTGHDLPARQRALALLVLVVAAGSLVAVVIQWARHGDGAQDWLHGGVAYIDRDDSSQLGWVDWAVIVTRRGLLHPGARRLRLETRVLLGLVPIASHEIRLSENDRAHASHADWTVGPQLGQSRGWDIPGLQADTGLFTRARIRTDHSVELQSESEGSMRLLDISTRGKGTTTADFVELLAGRINQRLNTIDWKARARRPGAPP